MSKLEDCLCLIATSLLVFSINYERGPDRNAIKVDLTNMTQPYVDKVLRFLDNRKQDARLVYREGQHYLASN